MPRHASHPPSRRLRPVAASAAVALLVACASDPASEAAPDPGADATVTTLGRSGGVRSVSGDGFQLELPSTWAAYRLSPKGSVEPVDGAPPLASGLDGLAIAAALQGATFLGVAPADPQGRSDTVMVTKLGPDDQPASADVSEVLRARLDAEGVTDLRLDTVDVGGRTAARATFRQVGESGLEQEAVTLYVPDARASFVVAFSRPVPEASPGSAAIVDEILHTFRLG